MLRAAALLPALLPATGPGGGLVADFAPSVRCGVGPLLVTFTDRSRTSDPGGVIAWEWDLDADGTVDSTQQHPVFVYGKPGVYTVSLQVRDASHAPARKVGEQLVCVLGGDECPAAVPIRPLVNGPYCSTCATTSPPRWPDPGIGRDVWFVYRAREEAMLAVSTPGSGFAAVVQVFRGGCGSLDPIACSDPGRGPQARVAWAAAPKTTYHIRVGGAAAAAGVFLLELKPADAYRAAAVGCYGTRLIASSAAPSGLPAPGTALRLSVTPAAGWGRAIWIDLGPTAPGSPLALRPRVTLPPSLLCRACRLGCNADMALAATDLRLVLPNQPVLAGARLTVQGADFGTARGCPTETGGPRFTVSDTIVVEVGSH